MSSSYCINASYCLIAFNTVHTHSSLCFFSSLVRERTSFWSSKFVTISNMSEPQNHHVKTKAANKFSSKSGKHKWFHLLVFIHVWKFSSILGINFGNSLSMWLINLICHNSVFIHSCVKIYKLFTNETNNIAFSSVSFSKQFTDRKNVTKRYDTWVFVQRIVLSFEKKNQ